LKRWVLFLAAVPLAIAGNICRIVMLTIGTIIIGSEKAIGTLEHPSFFHMLAGYVVFIVALGGMFGVEKLLTIQSSGSTIFAPASGPDSPAPRPAVDSPEGDLY